MCKPFNTTYRNQSAPLSPKLSILFLITVSLSAISGFVIGYFTAIEFAAR